MYCFFPSRGKFKAVSWDILNQHQSIDLRNSIDLCISGKPYDEIINGFVTFLEISFSDINCLLTQWYHDWERKRFRGVVKLVFDKEDVLPKPLYIPVNENQNRCILAIAFPETKLFVSHNPLKTDFKRKTLELILFLNNTSYCERRNQRMNFQLWKFDILNGRKQLNTTDCRVFVLAMAMEIATKEIIFDSLATIELRFCIASHCLSHNLLRSIPKRIKTQLEKITVVPRFKIDTLIHVYNFQDLFRITRRKENSSSGKEGLDDKNGRKIWFCITMILWLVSIV